MKTNSIRKNNDFILGLSMITGIEDHYFELDIGAYIDNGSDIYPIIDIGYRFQEPESGINFKVKTGSIGLGIGYNF